METRKEGVSFGYIALLVLSIIVPIFFPLWYVKFYKKQQKQNIRVAVFAGFALWLVIWTAAIALLIHKPVERHSSYYQTSYGDSDNYKQKTAEYESELFNKLKKPDEKAAATEAASEQSNNSSSSAPVSSAPSNNSSSSPSGGSDAMANIRIAEADNSPYKRSDYGSGWDVGGGCNIRARMLKAASTVTVQTSNGCTVTYGSWVDPYSGAVLTGNPYQGDGTANDLDIDHIIPLKYVNQHGGYAWDSARKVSYGKSLQAMENKVYIAVSSSENRKKSDKGPADYYPSNSAFRCEYAIRWRDIARIYSIALSQRDYNKVKDVLAECRVQ